MRDFICGQATLLTCGGELIGVGLFLLALAFFGFLWLSTAMREWRCKHDGGVSETMACDAICVKCGKNLGFIGAWRKRQFD
jgi:hypothetical protein